MVEILIIVVLAVYCGWIIKKKITDIKAGGCGCGCGGCDGCASGEKTKAARKKSRNEK